MTTGLQDRHREAYYDLAEFFVKRYIKLFASRRIAYRFRDDYSVIRMAGLDDGSWWMLERESGGSLDMFSSTVKHTRMEGFDVVIAISQVSINSQFTQLFKFYQTHLSQQNEDEYEIQIKTITVQLLQPRGSQGSWDEEWGDSYEKYGVDEESTATGSSRNSQAIVTVHISGGSLHFWLDEDLEEIRYADPALRIHDPDIFFPYQATG